MENMGVYIPADDLPKIFNAFYRVEQSRNRGTGGSGLGLFIVKMILEKHHIPFKLENTKNSVGFSMIISSEPST